MEGHPADSSYPLAVRPPAATCAACTSALVQLEAWRERDGGALTIRLRCAECDARMVRDVDAAEAAEVDDALSRARLEMVALYEAVVRNNVEIEAALLAKALELDLLGADDFAPRR